MYFKKMSGSKVYLSPIDKEDYVKYTEWLNDMEVSIGMPFAASLIDQESEKNILEKLITSKYNFAVIENKTNKVIGNVGFPNIDSVNQAAEVGIFIGDKEYWGNGYGREALELLMDFGFSLLNFNSIHLKLYSYNTPAMSCYKKIGFKEAGRLREAKIVAGKKYDEIYMDILAREFTSPYIASVLKSKIQGK